MERWGPSASPKVRCSSWLANQLQSEQRPRQSRRFFCLFHSTIFQTKSKITSATHALFLINSATSRLVELVWFQVVSFPFIPKKKKKKERNKFFDFGCVSIISVWEDFCFPQSVKTSASPFYRDPNNWFNFLENIKWHGVCLDLTSLPTKDYTSSTLRSAHTTTNGRR